MLQSDDRFKHYSCWILNMMDSEVFSILKHFTQLFRSGKILASKFILRSSFHWTCTWLYMEYSTPKCDSNEDLNPFTRWDGQCKSVIHFHQSLAFGSLNQLLTQTWFLNDGWRAWSSIWLCFKPFLLSSAFLILTSTWTFLQMVSSCIADECSSILILISSFISILT